MNRAAIVLALIFATSGAEAATRNFFSPKFEGSRLDACLGDGSDCGKPAADAFCRAQGFDRATLFQREKMASTRILNSEQICSGPSCIAFLQIKCYTDKNDLAGLEQLAE